MAISKIALPTNDRESVEEHFGHCKQFAIYNVTDGNVESIDYLDAPAHQPGLLPKFLGEHKINTIITGGMGQRAIDLFKVQNIEVILGATGTINSVLDIYLGGDLKSRGSACSHDHDEHGPNHGNGAGCNS